MKKQDWVGLGTQTTCGREENDFRRRFRDTLEILNQSPTLNRDRGFEPPAWCGDVARD